MCLAVPGKVEVCHSDEAVVDFQGNRMTVSTVLTPEARPSDWVLVHAGFAISMIAERDALDIWADLLEACKSEVVEQIATVKESHDAP